MDGIFDVEGSVQRQDAYGTLYRWCGVPCQSDSEGSGHAGSNTKAIGIHWMNAVPTGGTQTDHAIHKPILSLNRFPDTIPYKMTVRWQGTR
jgi:hypothetical protein